MCIYHIYTYKGHTYIHTNAKGGIHTSLRACERPAGRLMWIVATSLPGMCFRVQGSGFRVQGSEFRVEGLGFRV